MSSELPARDDRERFLEAMQAAADYIATNVRGHLVPATKDVGAIEVRVVELKERANNEDIPSAN